MKNFLWVMAVAVVIVISFTLAHVVLNRGSNQPLSGSSLQASLGGKNGLKIRQELKYTTTNEMLPAGITKSVSEVVSPVGAKISVTAASADTVTVQGMWQQGDDTVIVLRPASSKNPRQSTSATDKVGAKP